MTERRRERGRSGTGGRRALALALVVTVVSAGAGAGPPEVVRVRVPSDRVDAWLPRGTEITGLSASAFETLVTAAQKGAMGAGERDSPRLVRVRHSARWEQDGLVGRTEFLVRPGDGPEGVIALEPWTPAVEPVVGVSAGSVVSDVSGRTLLRVVKRGEGRGAVATSVEWVVRALAGSAGKTFSLGLPGDAGTEFSIDLPAGVVPLGLPGVKRGPTEAGDGRSRWNFVGRVKDCVLTLDAPGGAGARAGSQRPWVTGPTRVEVGEAVAAWAVDWDVSGGPRSPRQVSAALDPGLDLISVTGAEVEGYEAVPAGDGSTRISVRFVNRVGREPWATRVTVRAQASVPLEGRWVVPAARPVDAVWTGGKTSVRLDPSRVVETVRPMSGRRGHVEAGDTADDRPFEFDASDPGPVAEFFFRKPWADVTAVVQGQLLVGNTSPRLTCRTTWAVRRGRPHGLIIDVPRSWTADRVEFEGIAGSVTWRPEDTAGGTRLHIAPPPGDWPARPLVANIWATSSAAGGHGSVTLPRVVPAGARVTDEFWVARVEAGLALVPSVASGLTWVDHDPAAPPTRGPSGAPADGGRAALAWRWTGVDAEGRVDAVPAAASPVSTVNVVAEVSAGRLSVSAKVSVLGLDHPLNGLTLGLNGPAADADDWHFFDESTGQELVARRLAGDARSAAGVSGAGPAWRLDVPPGPRPRVDVAVRYQGPWASRGGVPLVLLPESLRAHGTVVVRAGKALRTSAAVVGCRALDPNVTAESISLDGGVGFDRRANSSLRLAHAFAYDGPTASLDLSTEELTPVATNGVIRDAELTTVVDPLAGPGRRRLSLRVAPDGNPTLEVTLPVGSSLERVRRDGKSVPVGMRGGAITVPVGTAVVSRPLVWVTLDYRTPAGPGVGVSAVVAPDQPRFSFPCLSFSWVVVVPEGWALADWSVGLRPADPVDRPRTAVEKILSGLGLGGRQYSASVVAGGGNDEALNRLAARLNATPAEETSLGEWLTRMDQGVVPIVVDRVSLALAGLGPRSRVVPPRAEKLTAAAATAAFRSIGLELSARGRVLLLGSAAAVLPGSATLDTMLSEAAGWCADASDRFQSVSRWREEAVPRHPADEATSGTEGREVWRFAASGWPGPAASVRLVDQRRRSAGTWAVALAVLTTGLTQRRRTRAARAAGVTALLGLGVLATERAALADSGTAAGLIVGAAGLASLWLGQALRATGEPAAREPRGESPSRVPIPGPRRGVFPALAILSAGVVAPLAAVAQGIVPGLSARPILAVFPFEGRPDPGKPPDRVLLKLADYEHLQDLAGRAATPPTPALFATEARHRIGRRAGGPGVASVETALVLTSTAAGPTRWLFPVDDAREITASLDGVETPVVIESGGKLAAVALQAVGGGQNYRLILNRRVRVRNIGRSESVRLAVNPVALSRAEAEAGPGGAPAVFPDARGRVEPADPGTTAAVLGPTGQLDVHWPEAGGEEGVVPSGSVEALYLWDATAGGDHVRARLTYHDPAGTALIRLAVEPGVVVRAGSVPGLVDESTAEGPGGSTWQARVAPPLPDGAAVTLDVFRPRTASGPGPSVRAVPKVEPSDVGTWSALLAFRRPPDWRGRIVPEAGHEAIGEDVFVRAWGGALPAEALTMSGAVRLNHPGSSGAWPVVTAGPPVPRFQVQPSVVMTMAAGKIELDLDAELVETEGPVDEVGLALPVGMRLGRVTADGLSDWSWSGPSAVRLRFDGQRQRRRRVRVGGWIAVAGDPLALHGVAETREIDTPWPRFPDQLEAPGSLTVISPTRARLVDATGAAATTVDPAGTGENPGPPFRAIYRIAPAEELGRLRWETEPPRVTALVQSQVSIEPETASWVAVLHYDVSGGPIDAVNLKLPGDWARKAGVWVDGMSHQLRGETRRDPETRRESTYWSIRPERPVWGSLRLTIRSTTPFAPGEVRAFPELTPLGPGGAQTYLRVVNATGGPIATEGSPGLQPVAAQAQTFDGELTASAPRGTKIATYHVVKSGWSLRFEKPSEDAAAAAVRHAELSCNLAADGSVLGMGRFVAGPRAGPFLGVEMGGGAAPLWASVDGVRARPLVAGPGRWLIPMTEGGHSRVLLVWRSDASNRGAAGTERLIPLPVVGGKKVDAVVSVRAPEGIRVAGLAGSLAPASRDVVELRKAGWLADQIVESLQGLDRSSRRSGEALVASLVRFELLLRQAGRAAFFDPKPPKGTTASRASQVARETGRLRERVSEALTTEALEEYEGSAAVALGLREGAPAETVAPSPEPQSPILVREIGTASDFAGGIPGATDSSPLVWTDGPPGDASELVSTGGLLAALCLCPPLFWAVARGTKRPRRWAFAGVALGLAACGWLAGPAWAAACAAAAAAGRFSRG